MRHIKITVCEEMGQALLFNTAAHPNRAARVHVLGCGMLNTANGTRHGVDAEEFADTIADLNERQYPVKHCKCTKEK